VTIDSLGSSYWGGLYQGWGVSPYANGGWITEPIAGVGLRSGRGYTLGEKEAELVIPRSRMGESAGGAGGMTVNVHLHGDYYGQSSFEDAVVGAIETGRKRGRL
jgi:hypothetical protein